MVYKCGQKPVLEDMSALNVVKIYILMIQAIDYHHVVNAGTVIM